MTAGRHTTSAQFFSAIFVKSLSSHTIVANLYTNVPKGESLLLGRDMERTIHYINRRVGFRVLNLNSILLKFVCSQETRGKNAEAVVDEKLKSFFRSLKGLTFSSPEEVARTKCFNFPELNYFA